MMDGFDPLAMPYLHSPLPFAGTGLQHMDYMTAPSMVDMQDQYSNFDSEYMSGDEFSFAPVGGLQHQAMMKRFSTGFDDPFAEHTMAQFEQMSGDPNAESPSIDRDSKYLSFSMPQYNFTLLDDSFRRSSVNIQAQLHGMFFLAESQWPATPDAPPPPPELTCYRRNLFQITGSITLPRNLRYVFTDDGSRIPIYELELAVSATESVEGNAVKIISVPWKTPTGGESSKADDKSEKEPQTIPLDKMSGQDLDGDYTTFPIQWKRLQFRIATANNGRRKELQQHFTLHLKIMASLSTGGKISIAEAHSGAVIVRGRSPRNFAARKDMPLSSSTTSRKHIPSLHRNSTSQTSVPQITSAPKVRSPGDDMPQVMMKFDNHDMMIANHDLSAWPGHITIPEPLPTPTYSATMNPPSLLPFVQESSPEMTTPGHFPFTFPPDLNAAGPGAMSLQLESGDESTSPFPPQQLPSRRSSRPPTSHPSPALLNKARAPTLGNTSVSPQEPPAQRPRLQSQQLSGAGVPTNAAMVGSQDASSTIVQRPDLGTKRSSIPFSPEGESVDQLYEYIPLDLADWLPPVDAVFRPHVVHHSRPTPDARSPIGRQNSNKRYFSEVM